MPPAPGFDGVRVVDLDRWGQLLDQRRRSVPWPDVADHLRDHLNVPPVTTDIFVFVHGWRNSPAKALFAAKRLFHGVLQTYEDAPSRYRQLGDDFRPYFLVVRWPSMGRYQEIRDRAHELSTNGSASRILGTLLGYLSSDRKRLGGDVLRTRDGHYLHCVGHSFGGRFLGEAIRWAADPPRPIVLGWPWPSSHPFAVDSLLVFQMAASPTIFDGRLASLLTEGPVQGPIVLTFSEHDRATGTFHRIAEGHPAIGTVGAVLSSGEVGTITLHASTEPYRSTDFTATRITNVDASWRYRRRAEVPGAHSDIYYTESAHLVLSIAALSR
ncbi:hypothetical protein [Cryptosporangium sp. NPDC051539]|uniref:hypothetical protein n=1 Tax=Cryptosporangium sp. NPDC051539 TaxID=3363962 RepID=UPI0037B29937